MWMLFYFLQVQVDKYGGEPQGIIVNRCGHPLEYSGPTIDFSAPLSNVPLANLYHCVKVRGACTTTHVMWYLRQKIIYIFIQGAFRHNAPSFLMSVAAYSYLLCYDLEIRRHGSIPTIVIHSEACDTGKTTTLKRVAEMFGQTGDSVSTVSQWKFSLLEWNTCI